MSITDLGDKPAVVEKLQSLSKVKKKSRVKIRIHQVSYNCSPVMGLERGCRLRSLGSKQTSPVCLSLNPGQNIITASFQDTHTRPFIPDITLVWQILLNRFHSMLCRSLLINVTMAAFLFLLMCFST